MAQVARLSTPGEDSWPLAVNVVCRVLVCSKQRYSVGESYSNFQLRQCGFQNTVYIWVSNKCEDIITCLLEMCMYRVSIHLHTVCLQSSTRNHNFRWAILLHDFISLIVNTASGAYQGPSPPLQTLAAKWTPSPWTSPHHVANWQQRHRELSPNRLCELQTLVYGGLWAVVLSFKLDAEAAQHDYIRAKPASSCFRASMLNEPKPNSRA